ncbi:Glutaminyl-peptide cyclotransferase-like protein [Smittium mucronatum]|uniref:Peptide hydrolase n=1 Tax=Smittium mucronatum TaxID=133383 RepID=A0A1R0H8T8_9FUNG|nr:Glutaminyl-peptide cyclotransferase-like protein [Smittium mucronatum]
MNKSKKIKNRKTPISNNAKKSQSDTDTDTATKPGTTAFKMFKSQTSIYSIGFLLLCLFFFINSGSSIKFTKPLKTKLDYNYPPENMTNGSSKNLSALFFENGTQVPKVMYVPQVSQADKLDYQAINIITGRDIKDVDIKSGSLLSPLLVARPVGSEAHSKVNSFLSSKLKEYGMEVTYDNFTESTVVGKKEFSNIIATSKNLGSAGIGKRLVLCAHYDSKILKTGDFVGATDSSVPVAIILSAVQMLSEIGVDLSPNSVQVLFFDGEEAFKDWTSKDSLYGSRHLASKMDSLKDPSLSSLGYNITQLEMIDLFLLLDLIGASNPSFYNINPASSNPTTSSIQDNSYSLLAKIEADLYDLGFLKKKFLNPFNSFSPFGKIDDDHRPFAERNVPILHIISTPFPKVWHTLDDNAENLDQYTVNHFTLLIRAFVLAFLDIHI